MRKAIIILLVILVLGFFYIHLDRFMESESFETDIEEILQSDRPDEAMVRSLVLKKAEERGIIINSDEIFITIVDTEEKTLAGSFVAKGGIGVETKKLTIKFTYTARSLGFSRTYALEKSRLFTVGAVLPGQEIPRD